jgi:flagellin-like protein
MNVFGRKERSWRKAQKRAVSPIIATILLVAITVVLAAVLYVLISGLTHGPGSTPIGTAFAAGNPVSSNTLGSGAASACATTSTTLAAALKTGDWVYTMTVESSTVSMGSVLLQVKTATGTFAPAAVGFYVTNIAGNVAACVTGAAGSMSSSLQFTYPTDVAATSATPLTTVYTISIDMGATNPTGQGYTFDAAGQGSYSGTTGALTLP